MIRLLAPLALLLLAACSRPSAPDTDRPVEPKSAARAIAAYPIARAPAHVPHTIPGATRTRPATPRAS